MYDIVKRVFMIAVATSFVACAQPKLLRVPTTPLEGAVVKPTLVSGKVKAPLPAQCSTPCALEISPGTVRTFLTCAHRDTCRPC